MGTLLNGHPKLVSEMEGRRWKLGLWSDDLRVEFKARGCLPFATWYVISLLFFLY